ncbi:MAG: hypothetical protein U0Q55_11335 [Vicinamibacterales bacterium]
MTKKSERALIAVMDARQDTGLGGTRTAGRAEDAGYFVQSSLLPPLTPPDFVATGKSLTVVFFTAARVAGFFAAFFMTQPRVASNLDAGLREPAAALSQCCDRPEQVTV